MTIQDLGSIGELVAAVATVATLAYLALQIRQNTRHLRDNARAIRLGEVRSATEGEIEFRRLLLTHPELDDVFERATRGEELDPQSARRFEHLLWEYGLRSQGRWYLVQQSVLSEAYWDRVSGFHVEYLRCPAGQLWWSQNRERFDPRFAEDVDRRLSANEESGS